MRNAAFLLTPLLVTFPFGSLKAQDKPWDLVGQVVSIEDGDDRPVKLARVGLTVCEFFRNGLTDDQGLFAIQMPAEAKPGQEVHIIHTKDNYKIFSPYRGRLRLPAPNNPPPFSEIHMLPVGSKRWLSDKLIDAHIEYERSRSAERVAREAGGRFDFEASLRELVTYTGITEQETRKQLIAYIKKFREDAADRHRQANAEFLARNYQLAGELYLKTAEELEGEGVERIRLAAYEREAAGDAFYNALDFTRALSTYQNTEKRLAAYRMTREGLGLKDYPQSKFDRRRLTLKAANARTELGARVAGPELTAYLDESVRTYRNLLAETPRSTEPRDWAITQNNLGYALSDLAVRSTSPRGGELLEEAIAAYRLALQVFTRDQLPRDWAMTQNNLGVALIQLTGQSEGTRGQELLGEAIAALKLALEVRTRDRLPQEWAAGQNNLGVALIQLAGQSESTRGQELLGEAIAALKLALEVRTRDQLPEEWATTQNNLGVALGGLAEQSADPRATMLLREAIAAYRLALEVRTRDRLPQDWATTQNNLGVTLIDLAARSEGPRVGNLLSQAIATFKLALEVRTRDQLPQDWAMTQYNLGVVLGDLAERTAGPQGRESLNQAIAAYQLALEVRTRDQLPQLWAKTQYNLGIALRDLAVRSEGPQVTGLLSKAIAAFELALEVRTRDQLPKDWAKTQYNLGIALRDLAVRSAKLSEVDLLKKAIAAFRLALQIYTLDQLPEDWALTQYNLGSTLRDLAVRSMRQQGAELLTEAITAYKFALQVYTRDTRPQQWAATQNNLGNAFRSLVGRESDSRRAADLLGEAVTAYKLALQAFTRDQLPQEWTETQNNLGIALQMYFAMEEFRTGLEQLDRLIEEKRLLDDPHFVALVYMLKILCHRGLGEDGHAADALNTLITYTERQPKSFRIFGLFAPLRRTVEKSKKQGVAASDRRNFLLDFLDAVSKENREGIVQSLRRLPK
jgi:tetratricopeptide (TPR) repeat protein